MLHHLGFPELFVKYRVTLSDSRLTGSVFVVIIRTLNYIIIGVIALLGGKNVSTDILRFSLVFYFCRSK